MVTRESEHILSNVPRTALGRKIRRVITRVGDGRGIKIEVDGHVHFIRPDLLVDGKIEHLVYTAETNRWDDLDARNQALGDNYLIGFRAEGTQIHLYTTNGSRYIIDAYEFNNNKSPSISQLTLRAEPGKPFKHDSCTFFPEGNWEDCCIMHDFLYWIGGTKASRKEADELLRECIINARSTFGNKMVAWIVYFGTRLFGGPHWPGQRKWGWGFDSKYTRHEIKRPDLYTMNTIGKELVKRQRTQ